MRRLLASTAIVLGLLAGGCKCPWEGRSVWLADAASAGKTLEARKGDELIVDLPVDPGSKAKWYFEVDDKVLARRGFAEEQPGGKSVRVTFDARRAGVTDVAATYAAAKDAPPLRTFRTTVWVR
jgi:hypothetical protein